MTLFMIRSTIDVKHKNVVFSERPTPQPVCGIKKKKKTKQ